ncbi:acyl--CoA ligase [Xanthomonas sp. CFBP 8703]|uniref:Acyl--CoA ligase n=1 Tax=Xanthomonas bonasiae TaxID=2810351 RepID=A0ABS3BC07_9XANT|nr:class I adenylate-forming enzyme family protein [Xanthomonas bonasiae]MBN6104469.1 acyl--CoA ligase [Xanthomonas bonasiae]
MNAAALAPFRAQGWRDALAASGSVVHLNGESATLKQLLDTGRERWQAYRMHRRVALLGIGDLGMLSLQLTAIVDGHPLLLCAGDATPPALCDAHIGAAAGNEAAASPLEIAPPPAGYGQWPDGVAVLSSGTVGTPKVIWHAYDDLLATGAMVLRRLELGAHDRVLITVPLHHMYGLGAALIPALLAGAQIHLLAKANLLGFNDALRAAQPTWVFSTPHLLRMLLQRKNDAVASCRGLVLAGDGTPPSLHAQAQRVFNRVFDLYGSSELGVVAISEPNAPKALRPLEGVRACLADADAAQGTLIVSHPHAATHIAHQGTLSALPAEWDTRDIATFDDSGGFAIRGRADLSLNRAGRLLILADLEGAIMGWPDVDQAVAIVLEDETTAGKAIAAVIKPSTSALTIDALKRHASMTLPAFARPDHYTLVSDLPCLGSGKPDRKTIIKEYRHG